MNKLKRHFSKIIFFSLFYFFAQNSFANSRSLTVFTEQNMAPALTKIASLYSQKNNVIISINFNASYDLINEIDMGEPADVFITAHSGMIDTLKQKGLVDVYNISYIAQDKLNLVISKNSPNIDEKLLEKNITLREALVILDEDKSTIILDQEESSSGLHSQHLIQSLSLQNLKLFKKLKEDKTSIFNILENTPENYAILLSSQIKNKKDLLVLATTREDNIFYQALVIAGDSMEMSREFLRFLKSNEARKILKDSGFIVN